MIQVIATNLTQLTTKDKSEEENIKLGFTEYLPFSRNQSLAQLSGELPIVQVTFTIEEDDFAENEEEKKYVIDNAYMLLANNVKEVMGDFLINYAHFNYDVKSTMAPISYDGFNQETDAKILSIRFYPRKFRQDQLLCRCFVIIPRPLEKEDIVTIEELLHKKINNFETELESKKIKVDSDDKLPEELSSAKIDSDAGNSFEESVCVLPGDIQDSNNEMSFTQHSPQNHDLINENNDEDDDINIDDIVSNQKNNLNTSTDNNVSSQQQNNDEEDMILDDLESKTTNADNDLKSSFAEPINSAADLNNKEELHIEKKAKRLNDKISQYLDFMSFMEADEKDDIDEVGDDEDVLQHFNQSIEANQHNIFLIDEQLNSSLNASSLDAALEPTDIIQEDTSSNDEVDKTNADVVPVLPIEENIVNSIEETEENNAVISETTEQQSENRYSDKERRNDIVKEKEEKIDNNVTSFMSDELNKYLIGSDDLLQSVNNKIDENQELFIEIFDNLAEYKTVSKKEVLNDAFSKVIKFFKNNEKTQVVLAQRDEEAKKELLQSVELHIDKYVTEIPNDDKTLLNSMVKRALLSYYILTPLINDNTISDIKVLDYNKINIKKSGLHYTVSNLSFIDEVDYKSFIDNLVERYQVPINSMFLVFSDIDFNKDYRLRFNISLPFVNSTGLPYLHIRKVPKNKLSIPDLIDAKMMTPEIALYLIDAIRNKSILISGPSASGKTNLANALIDMIPYEYSGLVIQESEELFSDKHPNLMFQHIIKSCDLEALGTNGLLCDAGYFIIGEIKGKEARNFSKAAATGHKCMATIHASSSAKSIDRLVDYIRLGDKNYTTEDSLRLIQDMNVLVFVKDFKIQEIDEVVGIHENGQELIYKPIYRYNGFVKEEVK